MTTRILSKRLAMLSGLTMFAGLVITQQASAQVSCPAPDAAGNPVVHQQHIFCGEINKKGYAVGFHSRPGGVNPQTVTDTSSPEQIKSAPEGIYLLRKFSITEGGRSGQKALSTMFPDACSQADVVAAIQNAVQHSKVSSGQFTGPSGSSCQAGTPAASFDIVGYLDDDGEVITAWPNYR
ncbi:EndoU domain-containing protein [Pseudomonas oryzihabitans]|uniref:EndoU domain-containing protein n=1 Tax=Pseudomonas oryzihabitans TaxID=47885 RepID=UPI00286540C1|nr:EndoU domain-containing protein [Pseudomonas psychrotolerans]MDR6679856.1 hypothetical protein [Pseudomonas psychrotolerans]